VRGSNVRAAITVANGTDTLLLNNLVRGNGSYAAMLNMTSAGSSNVFQGNAIEVAPGGCAIWAATCAARRCAPEVRRPGCLAMLSSPH
jgi:hypothetical protein